MSDKATIFHNPRCSKSRAALEYLENMSAKSDLEVVKIEYLIAPPDRQTLLTILQELQLQPRELMRQGESIYNELNLKDPALTDDQLIDAIVEHPILMQRPVIRYNNEATIGRSLDKLIELLDV